MVSEDKLIDKFNTMPALFLIRINNCLKNKVIPKINFKGNIWIYGTHQELSRCVGMSGPTVRKYTAMFEKLGILQIEKAHKLKKGWEYYYTLNFNKLKEIL